MGQDWSRVDYTNTEISVAIDEYIHSERDREILRRRLIDGICFEPLAEEFDMSVRQIKSIVYKCQQIVFPKLAKGPFQRLSDDASP